MFKAIDRRIIAGFTIGILLAVVLFITFVRPSQAAHTAAREQQATVNAEVGSLRARISEIQQNGTSSIDALIAKVKAIETALPLQIDDLTLASTLSTAARSNGVELSQFDLRSDEPEKASSLEFLEYSLAVRGSTTAVLKWLSSVQKSTEFVITFSDVSLGPDSESKSIDPSAIGDNVQLDATMRVWMLKSTRLVNKDANAEAAAEATDAAPATNP